MVEQDSTDDELPTPAMPGWVKPSAIAALACMVVAYAIIWYLDAQNQFGPRGDAVGPFAALFNAGALFAALWAVQLQRTELALQREELRANRLEMQEQRVELKRTAEAQQALAESQAKLAQEQHIANGIALKHLEVQQIGIRVAASGEKRAAAAELAQRANVVATLLAADLSGIIAIGQAARPTGSETRSEITKQLSEQMRAYESLRSAIEKGAV